MIGHAQVIATESRNNVLSHKKKHEEDRQLNRQGDVVGGSRKEGRYGGFVNIQSMGHNSIFIFEMYMPCRACLLNSSIYAFMHNTDFA